MLNTIEVEVDERGGIHPLEPLPAGRPGRALLTLLDASPEPSPRARRGGRGNYEALRAVLESPEFTEAVPGDPEAMERAIDENRNAWGD